MSGVTLTAGSYDVIEDDALKCCIENLDQFAPLDCANCKESNPPDCPTVIRSLRTKQISVIL